MQKRPNTNLNFTDEEIAIILEFFPEGICAFDLEMTGLSPLFDKIIEIAGCRVLPDGTWDTYHSLVNPLIPIPEHTIKYHQLTNDILRDSPSLKKPLSDFIEYYGNLPLLAHNSMFDASFLMRGIHEYHFPISLSSVYDSCRMARAIYKRQEAPPTNFKLSTLAEFYNFDFDHHQALDDAIVCLKIYAKCLIEFKNSHKDKNLKVLSFLFKLNSFKNAETYILPNKLKELKNYVQQQKQVYIKYKGGSSKGKLRPIKPVSLLPMPQGLILYAECLNSNMNKYFHVKKIQCLSDKPDA
jgi:DNA polymerase III epsilon subunit family exonuclease